MNIIRMSGGIGNQMFQYALYLRLISLGKEVKFDDITEYMLDNARPIMLPVFGINYPKADKEEIIEITDGAMGLADRVRRKISGRKSREYREASVNYDSKVLNQDSAYLCGCFQSERYFKEIEETVRAAFIFRNIQIPESLQEQIEKYERQIGDSCAVSIHIRRGDYLEAESVYGGICTEAYYRSAAQYILERYPKAHFYVFTNDTLWAEQWCMTEQLNSTVVKGTSEENGYIDLMLMSRCSHHIIANSSFSWWGAWLNPSGDKCVIAPDRWLNTCEQRDIYTPNMVRIDADGKINYNYCSGL